MYKNYYYGKNRNTYKKEWICLQDDSINTKSGTLIIIGGAEDKKGEKGILKEVSEQIDKENGKLVIATIASQLQDEVGADYEKLFKELGVKNIRILKIQTRKDSFEESNLEIIKDASLLFFTGGDQLRITSLLGGTALYKAIKDSYKHGCTLAGTSAGASIMSDPMIIEGLDVESPRKCTLKMAPGLGFITGVLIDQHFAQRGRIGRLLVGIAENPESIGIGIDEDTAIIVKDCSEFKVIGSGAVYVIDGSDIVHSNVSEQHPDEILSIWGIKLHVLINQDSYDLLNRQPF